MVTFPGFGGIRDLCGPDIGATTATGLATKPGDNDTFWL